MEVIPGIHLVDGSLGCNVYLILDENITLVDAGLPGNSVIIERYLKKIGRAPKDIEQIFLTHYHPDHIGAVPELHRKYGCHIAIHSIEAPYVEGRLPATTLRTWGAVGTALSLAHQVIPLSPVPVASPLQDGSVFGGSGKGLAIHTPGHTAGSLCLYLPDRRLLFTGDALVHTPLGLDLAGFPVTVDRRQGHRSLLRLTEFSIETLCFGHGSPTLAGGDAALSGFLQTVIRRR
jgi:glyoxylase-like metal-dependent hydrolase (beta-lactamase superfamily II)